MDVFSASARVRQLDDAQTDKLFATLNASSISSLRSGVMSALYDRVTCERLDIPYSRLGDSHVRRAYVYRAFVEGVL